MQPDGVKLWFVCLFDLTDFILWNVKGLRHRVSKILRDWKIVFCSKNSVSFYDCRKNTKKILILLSNIKYSYWMLKIILTNFLHAFALNNWTNTEQNFKESVCEKWKGVLAYGKIKHFWSLLILLLSVALIRRKLLKTTHTEIRSFHTKFRKLQHSTGIVKKSI